MKKIGLIIGFCILTSLAFGQQILWSTIQAEGFKHVPLNNVTNEVLKLYDQYEYYYDYSGFTKKSLIEKFDEWQWVNDINDRTVLAVKANTGNGSFVTIICINEENCDMIIFSNTIQLELGTGSISTSTYKRETFASWFKTILNGGE